MNVILGFDPILMALGPFQIGWHGIFTALAVALAVAWGTRRGRAAGATSDQLQTIALWAVGGGVVGARLFHVLDHLPYYAADPLAILAIWQGGIAVYGSLLGGVVAGVYAARYVWRDYAFIGPESGQAAEAARCAGDQGQFWAYHDKLYTEQSGENRGAFANAKLKQFATQLNLDRGGFDACLDGHAHAADVQADVTEGNRRTVRATPTLFINGQKIEGAPSYDQLKAAIATASGR